MRVYPFFSVLLLSLLIPALLPEAGASEFKVDAETQKVLQEIDSLSAHEAPRLPLKKDARYADTAKDVEPFGGVKPYKRHFLDQMEYTGPGRSIAEPKDLSTVKIGFIGPIESTVSVATGGKSHEEPLGKMMLRGAQLALEEANARGGYIERKIPFELVIKNDNGLWGASGNEIIDLAYNDKVWGILGTIDGANSHIAIRVALKAEIVMMNSGDTDPTLLETGIPWILRCIGDDRRMGYLLIDYMIRKRGLRQIGIIRSSNRYGRFGVREIRDSARRLGHPIVLEMAYKVGIGDFKLQLERLKEANLDAVVHWGNAEEAGLILKQMRRMGMKQSYFTSDRAVADSFLRNAGEYAEGVISAYPWNPNRNGSLLRSFKKNFQRKFKMDPDTYSAHGYDGMNLLIWATQVAGLNRAKIRDILAYRKQPWPGVTGEISFSASLGDVGEVFLAQRRKRAWHFLSRADLKIPKKSQ